MTNKMTKKEMFAMVLATLETLEVENKEIMITGIQHEIELLESKKSKSGSTKTQKENETVMVQIQNALAEVGRPVTITELQNEVVEMAQYSNQKLSALLRKLCEIGAVVKVVEKKKSYFSLA